MTLLFKINYSYHLACLLLILVIGCSPPTNTSTLEKLVSQIDKDLLEQNEQDIRAWLDARIHYSGDFGLYSWGRPFRINGDTAIVDLNRGALADAAAQFFRAYEMFGDKKYLEAGLKTADFFLEVQQPSGHFPCGATVLRNGKAIAGGGKCDLYIARMEDGYQFRPFSLLMYSYKLTGNKKYFEGARKVADLITTRTQHPEWGWCPDEFDTRIEGDVTRQQESHGGFGVRGGGSWSDGATTDGFRASIIMYHATGEKKYIERSAKLGKWIFATQLGVGDVRGWADNYNADNQPVPARGFEGETIDPRNFNRFVGPAITWFYAITGHEKYADLFRESYAWMKSQEHPDGWAAEFTNEGLPAWTQEGITYRYDQPETWPDQLRHLPLKDGKPWYARDKVQLEGSRIVYELLQDGSRDALTGWYHSPTNYNNKEYKAARKAAALRCTNGDMTVALRCTSTGNAIKGNYLERVRMRLAAPNQKDLTDNNRRGLDMQSWHGPHTWQEPYRPPFGWASWQYVWDARLALGLIGPEIAASGGRGMENMHYWSEWDVMGDWTTRSVEVENWFDVPLDDYIF